MKRRDFLRKAGMAGLGVVAAPAVVSALPKPKPKPYPVDNSGFDREEARLVAQELLKAARPIIKQVDYLEFTKEALDEMNKKYI